MKKIEVKQNGETTAKESAMSAKQKRNYLQKVSDALFRLSTEWDEQTSFDHTHPLYFALVKATAHTMETLQTEQEEIPMRFAFSNPEHCAIYLAFCFGAYNCVEFSDLSKTSLAAIATIKVLTSAKARNEVLEG